MVTSICVFGARDPESHKLVLKPTPLMHNFEPGVLGICYGTQLGEKLGTNAKSRGPKHSEHPACTGRQVGEKWGQVETNVKITGCSRRHPHNGGRQKESSGRQA